MSTITRFEEVAGDFSESIPADERGDQFADAAGRSGHDSSNAHPGRLGITRSQLYDAPNIASERLPSSDPKAFGMLRRYASEDTSDYVEPPRRNQFTPMVKMYPNSGAHLVMPDGSPLHTASLFSDFEASDTPYVVVPDHTQPGGERLLIDLYGNPPSELHHSSLANGQPVKYAGLIETNPAGKITRISTNTGHYRLPDSFYARELIESDETLSSQERREQLAEMEAKAGAFSQLINDKFRPFMRNPGPIAEPTTPPLRLNKFET